MAGLQSQGRLVAADIVIVVIYFVLVLAVGLWSSFRNRGSVGGYFLAGRSMHWIPVGASLFASNIGSGHFIGLAGSGASSGIGIAAFELNAIFILMLLGWIFVPVYIAAGVFTMPEYLRKRFGGQRIRVYLSVLALLLSIFTKVAADLYAGATFIEQSTSINLYLAVVILLAIAAIFTITGGLTAVIWTDFAQTIIMVVGSFILMVIGFIKVGGYQSVRNKYLSAVPNTTRYYMLHPELDYNYTQCGIPPANSFHLFRSADDPNLPWTGIIFGLTISSVWYWCSDQVIVQRALAAKNLTYAKAGTILAGYLKILPMWLLVLPGMIARILYPDEIGCADPQVCENFCGIKGGCSNVAYPTLVLTLMPDGLRGLMLAVMIAALMSSLSSIFNSSSTLFTMDIWTRIRKNASDNELMLVGRFFVLFMVAISILWLPIVKNFSELFHYIQSITSYLAPPICAIYVLAILWKRTNEPGAFWGLMAGLLVGLIRFIWEFSYSVPACGEGDDPRPSVIKDVHYLNFGIILFFLVLIVTICISLITEPIGDHHLPRLTFWSRYSTEERIDISEDEKEAPPSGKDNPALDVSKDETLSHGASNAGIGSAEPEEEKTPIWKKVGMWICGIEKTEQPQMSEEEKMALEEKQNSLKEDPFWNKVVVINAVGLMVVAVFFWAFFY